MPGLTKTTPPPAHARTHAWMHLLAVLVAKADALRGALQQLRADQGPHAHGHAHPAAAAIAATAIAASAAGAPAGRRQAQRAGDHVRAWRLSMCSLLLSLGRRSSLRTRHGDAPADKPARRALLAMPTVAAVGKSGLGAWDESNADGIGWHACPSNASMGRICLQAEGYPPAFALANAPAACLRLAQSSSGGCPPPWATLHLHASRRSAFKTQPGRIQSLGLAGSRVLDTHAAAGAQNGI